MRFFALGFFHESSSPKPLKKTQVSFQFCSKIHGDICKSWCIISITNIGGKFAIGFNDKRVSTTPVVNLPLVSMAPAVPVSLIPVAAGVIDTDGAP
jgi:hypothetical protein